MSDSESDPSLIAPCERLGLKTQVGLDQELTHQVERGQGILDRALHRLQQDTADKIGWSNLVTITHLIVRCMHKAGGESVARVGGVVAEMKQKVTSDPNSQELLRTLEGVHERPGFADAVQKYAADANDKSAAAEVEKIVRSVTRAIDKEPGIVTMRVGCSSSPRRFVPMIEKLAKLERAKRHKMASEAKKAGIKPERKPVRHKKGGTYASRKPTTHLSTPEKRHAIPPVALPPVLKTNKILYSRLDEIYGELDNFLADIEPFSKPWNSISGAFRCMEAALDELEHGPDVAVTLQEDSPPSFSTDADGDYEDSAGESGSEDGGFEDADVNDLTLEEFEDVDFEELLKEQEPQEGDMPFMDWPGAPKKGDGDLRELKKRWDAESGLSRKSVFDEDH